MEIKKIKLSDIEGTETNPFVLELKGNMFLQPRANTIVAKGQSLVNTETGEVLHEEQILIGKRKIVDKSQFAKLYASEIGILYELSKPAQNVFLHLTKVMDYDNKAIFVYYKEYTKLGYKTDKSVLKGLKELIRANIIAPHIANSIWWLNPLIVCKGERFAKYTQYVAGTEEEVRTQNLLNEQSRNIIERVKETTNKVDLASGLFDSDNKNPYQ